MFGGFLSLFLSSAFAHAPLSCADHLLASTESRVELHSDFVSEPDIQFFPRTIASANKYIGGELFPVPLVRIQPSSSWERPGHLDDKSLVIGLEPSLLKRDARVAAAVLVHEYGHLVFIRSLGRFFAEWGQYYDRVFQSEHWKREVLSPLRQRLWDWMERLRSAKLAFPAQAPEVLKIQQEHDLAYAEFNPVFERWQRLSPMRPNGWAESLPYQELFADLLAVLVLDDPQAIARMQELEPRAEKSQVGLRDFSAPPDARDWDGLEAHLTLVPVRHHLWKRYLSRPLSHAQRMRVLSAVFQVSREDLLLRSDAQRRGVALSGSMNSRLILALDSLLQHL